MNGSPSAILTLGLGDWGSPGLLLTLGLGVGAAAATPATSFLEYTAPQRTFDYTAPMRVLDFTAPQGR